ncbi:MAG: 1-deoxy-D-xylulose-5-phosphate synthase [Candidatus Harrisonbacteria bacterium]|nr:1-deoxy-D-xylulose-5-phosphate synthase [Candidatus Harrisonbacteria bacterium]
MRKAFIDTLFELARKDKNIFLLNADLGFSVLEKFNQAYPKRAINMGIAEANSIGTAAGLALSGKTVFVYSIIPFVTFRVLEQIRNDVAMQEANVKIVGIGSGWSYGSLGATHHAIEDIAVLRSIPGMRIVCPGDPIEAAAATKAITKTKGPFYFRLNKAGDPIVHKTIPKFRIGEAIQVRPGKDLTIITTGNALPGGAIVSDILSEDGLSVRLISMHTIKPLDEATVKKAAKETKAIFTLEDHNILGGLGSAVAEILAENRFGGVFHRFGAKDAFTHIAGPHDFLREHHGLSPKNIARVIRRKIA